MASIEKRGMRVPTLWFLLLVFPFGGTAEASDEAVGESFFAPALDHKLEAFRHRFKIPGISLGYVLPDGTEGRAFRGFGDPDAKTALTEKGRFLAGSVGKTYVAAVAMQLAGEGRLDLDAKVDRYLAKEEWFPRLPNAKDFTVRMLMNHTSGIPEHVYDDAFCAELRKSPYRAWKPEELIRITLDKEPLFAAGADWSYADTNYILLGIVLERVAGEPYYDLLRRRILEPFGLDETSPSEGPDLPGLVVGNSIRPCPLCEAGSTFHDGKLRFNPQCEWTGGGVVTTPLDLARWALILFGSGRAYKEELRPEALDGVPARTAPGDRYGLGVQIWRIEEQMYLGHGGWFPGYLSLMAYVPERRLARAGQLNCDGGDKASAGMRRLLHEVAALLVAESSGSGGDGAPRH